MTCEGCDGCACDSYSSDAAQFIEQFWEWLARTPDANSYVAGGVIKIVFNDGSIAQFGEPTFMTISGSRGDEN